MFGQSITCQQDVFSTPANADATCLGCHELFACIQHEIVCVQLVTCKLAASATTLVRALTSIHKRGGILLEAWHLGICCSND